MIYIRSDSRKLLSFNEKEKLREIHIEKPVEKRLVAKLYLEVLQTMLFSLTVVTFLGQLLLFLLNWCA